MLYSAENAFIDLFKEGCSTTLAGMLDAFQDDQVNVFFHFVQGCFLLQNCQLLIHQRANVIIIFTKRSFQNQLSRIQLSNGDQLIAY